MISIEQTYPAGRPEKGRTMRRSSSGHCDRIRCRGCAAQGSPLLGKRAEPVHVRKILSDLTTQPKVHTQVMKLITFGIVSKRMSSLKNRFIHKAANVLVEKMGREIACLRLQQVRTRLPLEEQEIYAQILTAIQDAEQPAT